MPRKVKWAVIGLGWFGEKHCEALAGLPNAELYALCTRTKSRLDGVSARFGVEHMYTDYHELLANPDVEAVSITTMWDQHTAPALASIQSGKHVFLEKPMASTVEDCAGDRAGGQGIGQVFHGRTYLPLQSALRRCQTGN